MLVGSRQLAMPCQTDAPAMPAAETSTPLAAVTTPTCRPRPYFQPVMVEEPTPEEAELWLQGLRGQYEKYHGVRFTDAALGTGG
jgi:hypothetical protein